MKSVTYRLKHLIGVYLICISCSVVAQTNNFPSSGDAEIRSGQLLIETNSWRDALLTFKDIHYAPIQLFKFQIESDGLKIKQDNTTNYQFKSGGDFLVNNGGIGVGVGASAIQNKLQIGPNPQGWNGNDVVISNSN